MRLLSSSGGDAYSSLVADGVRRSKESPEWLSLLAVSRADSSESVALGTRAGFSVSLQFLCELSGQEFVRIFCRGIVHQVSVGPVALRQGVGLTALTYFLPFACH